LQLKFFLAEMNWIIQLRVWSDPSFGRGIMSRLGGGRVLHIETRYLLTQEALRAGRFLSRKKETNSNAADIGTNVLEAGRLQTLMHSLSLRTRGSTGATRTARGIMVLSILGTAEGTAVATVGACLAHPAPSGDGGLKIFVFIVGSTVGLIIGVVVGCILSQFWTVRRAVSEPLLAVQPAQPQQLQQPHTTTTTTTPSHKYLILSDRTVVDLKFLLRYCGLTVVGNKPDLIERMLSSGRMIIEEKCRLTLMAQASRGAKMPIEHFVNTERADAW
jgi:hypothetical protein